MVDPVNINLSPARVTVENIKQSYITVDEDRKFELLLRILDRDEPRQSIIFCERKRWVEDLYRHLRLERKRVAMMHGDLAQSMRNRIMQGFRDGKIIRSGGDRRGRPWHRRERTSRHVIDYDIPMAPGKLCPSHRPHRGASASADGIAIAFVTPEQGGQLTEIESFINKQIHEDRIEGFKAYTPRRRQTAESPESGKRYGVSVAA